MSFCSCFNSQSLQHGPPFYKLRLHLGLDLEGMVGYPLGSVALRKLPFELQYPAIEGEIL